MRRHHLIVTAMAAICGFAAVVLAVVFSVTSGESIRDRGEARIGGAFALVDDTGAAVTEQTLAGKPSAIYFGYTFCPEVCPTTLLDLSRWIQKLGADADKLNYVFVSVDPARDTPALMHTYLSSFDKHIRGFTGTAAQVAHEYRVYYKRIPTDDGGYVMDHSAVIYLMAADGKLVSMIAYQEDDASALAKLRSLAGAATPSS